MEATTYKEVTIVVNEVAWKVPQAVAKHVNILETELDAVKASDKDAWAWIDVACKALNCGELGVFAIEGKVAQLEAKAEHFRGMLIQSGMFDWFLDEEGSSVAAKDETGE